MLNRWGHWALQLSVAVKVGRVDRLELGQRGGQRAFQLVVRQVDGNEPLQAPERGRPVRGQKRPKTTTRGI